ncbi:DUF1761 family protein [Leptobacterium flavescens]|uniref:DUF1761 family protein n=1 Tax=Leptobacterium flavescens TaxID=472055 RepID=A0A6P0UP07_9FLAO|nr:DUF1761 domain-containing protein [Leptobacterium flavescens]NER13668.1 DUF1761 family protein [Leptobacterium flavescens]
MDLASAFENINWLSVLAAAVSSFLLGGIWYGPLFGRAWMKEFGFTEDDLKKRNIPKTFGLSLILAFIAAFILDMFIGYEADLMFGMMAGFFAGLGWVATFTGIQYLFEMKSFKAFYINAGYSVISLMLMGIILGAW